MQWGDLPQCSPNLSNYSGMAEVGVAAALSRDPAPQAVN